MFVLLAISAIGLVMGWRLGQRIVNPATVFFGTWLSVLLAYMGAGDKLYPLSDTTVAFVWPAILVTGLGSIIGMLGIGGDPRAAKNLVLPLAYLKKPFERTYAVLCWMLLGYILLQLIKLWPTLSRLGGLNGILFGVNGLNFRQSYLADRGLEAQEGFAGGGLALALLGYALFVGAASLILAGYLAAVGRWSAALIPIAMMAGYALVLLERATFLYAACLFLFSYIYHRRLVNTDGLVRASKDKWALGFLVALTAAIAIVPAAVRALGASGDRNGQGSAVSYLYAGLAGLNGAARGGEDFSAPHTGIASPLYYDRPLAVLDLQNGHGVWTFEGIMGIVQRLGLEVQVPSGFSYVRTGPYDGSISNVYTYMIYPYYDWGYVGMLVVSLVLGLVAGRADKLAVTRGSPVAIVLATLTMSTLLMSFFGLGLVRDFRFLFLIPVAAMLLKRLRLSSSAALPFQGAATTRSVGR